MYVHICQIPTDAKSRLFSRLRGRNQKIPSFSVGCDVVVVIERRGEGEGGGSPRIPATSEKTTSVKSSWNRRIHSKSARASGVFSLFSVPSSLLESSWPVCDDVCFATTPIKRDVIDIYQDSPHPILSENPQLQNFAGTESKIFCRVFDEHNG